MKRWALIDGGRVVTITESDEMPTVFGPWVECPHGGPGWIWDGEDFSPAEPEVGP